MREFDNRSYRGKEHWRQLGVSHYENARIQNDSLGNPIAKQTTILTLSRVTTTGRKCPNKTLYARTASPTVSTYERRQRRIIASTSILATYTSIYLYPALGRWHRFSWYNGQLTTGNTEPINLLVLFRKLLQPYE